MLRQKSGFYFFGFFFFFWVGEIGNWERILLCSSGWSWIHDHPASTSKIMGLQAQNTTPSRTFFFKTLNAYDPRCLICPSFFPSEIFVGRMWPPASGTAFLQPFPQPCKKWHTPMPPIAFHLGKQFKYYTKASFLGQSNLRSLKIRWPRLQNYTHLSPSTLEDNRLCNIFPLANKFFLEKT